MEISALLAPRNMRENVNAYGLRSGGRCAHLLAVDGGLNLLPSNQAI